MSHIEYDEEAQPATAVDITKELKEARQLKAARAEFLAAGRKKGVKRRHVVVSFTLGELAEALGVSKRKLQRLRKDGKVDLADRRAVAAMLRNVGVFRSGRRRCGT